MKNKGLGVFRFIIGTRKSFRSLLLHDFKILKPEVARPAAIGIGKLHKGLRHIPLSTPGHLQTHIIQRYCRVHRILNNAASIGIEYPHFQCLQCLLPGIT